jgi:hypothetical protein
VINIDREVRWGGWCGPGRGPRSAGAAAGVEAEFAGSDGVMRREPLSGCWNVAFERVAPVRDSRRSADGATGRACGGSLLPGSMCATSLD